MSDYEVDGLDCGRRWQGQWLWAEHAPKTNAYVMFRREFTCPTDGAGWRLLLSADTRCRLWINGTLLPYGPPQSMPYLQYYDSHALDGLLTPGTNTVAILVHHHGTQPDSRGGLLAELLDDTGAVVVASDRQWRTRIADAWSQSAHRIVMNVGSPFQEICDTRAIPSGWLQSGFDDAAWSQPLSFTRPWMRLVARDIPYMAERHIYPQRSELSECLDIINRNRPQDLTISLSQASQPLEFTTIEQADALLGPDGVTIAGCSTMHLDRRSDGRYDPVILLDFGHVHTGYAWLDLDVGEPGTIVEIGYAERLVNGQFTVALEGHFGDAFTLGSGRQTVQPFMWRSFRYLRLRFKRCETPVRIHTAAVLENTYPYAERGGFQASDQTLVDVWDICRRTLRLCSNESLMDTPQREQAQWLGDVAGITLGGVYSCFGDTALPAKFLRQSGANCQPSGVLANLSNVVSTNAGWDIGDYSLWWLMGLRDFYRFGGDARIVHHHWPSVLRVMQAHLARLTPAGSLDQMPGWVFIDWANLDKRGECAANNAMLAGALDAVVELAELRGDSYARDQAAAAATRLRAVFAERFFDAERGVVVDARRGDEWSDSVSEHANAAAILFDCLTPEQVTSVVEHIWLQRDVKAEEAQPFFCFFVLRALRRAGRMDLAIDMIRDRWGGRMVARGFTSCSEEWNISGTWRTGEYSSIMRTLSHAWSAGPAQFLVHDLLGLEILEPGCSRLRLSPHRGDFTYDVVCPTPAGDLTVHWDGTRLQLETPAGMVVDVVD